MVVVAKEPVPGKVKTRLTPALTQEEAATLYQCMLEDRIQEISCLDEIDLAIAYTPADAKGIFTRLTPPGFSFFSQRGKDLGERLSNIFIDTFAAGYETVAIIDSDTPDLPRSVIKESFQLLLSQKSEVVFGPCHDGGYYLIGMCRPHPELFDNIPWSTVHVLEATLERVKGKGLKSKLLAFWDDLDTFEDLIGYYKKYCSRERRNRCGEKTMTFLSNFVENTAAPELIIALSNSLSKKNLKGEEYE